MINGSKKGEKPMERKGGKKGKTPLARAGRSFDDLLQKDIWKNLNRERYEGRGSQRGRRKAIHDNSFIQHTRRKTLVQDKNEERGGREKPPYPLDSQERLGRFNN